VLASVARTSLRTKLLPELADQLTDIVTDAVLIVRKEGEPIDLHMVREEAGCLRTWSERRPPAAILQVAPRRPVRDHRAVWLSRSLAQFAGL